MLVDRLSSIVYWPLCRAYARRAGNRPADAALARLCSLQFRLVHGFWPDYSDPRHFTEKLWCRMLYERDPRLTLFCDKVLVRDFVAETIGPRYLVQLLWNGTDPSRIPFDELPPRFVIKTNHGCGFNILVPDRSRLDAAAAVRRLRRWLRVNFCDDTYLGIAWGYKNIPPRVMIERFLGEEDSPPVDYKMYCLGGRVEFLTAHYDRFGTHRYRSFDREFSPYPFRYDLEQWDGACERPSGLHEMVSAAEALARDTAFVRVDMYSVGDEIYFGEMTPYPGGVATQFLPRSTDLRLGQLWRHS